MEKMKRLPIFTTGWLILLSILASGCGANQPLRVGLSAELSGKFSEAGVNLRNGAQMAVDELNANGGIGGRKLELVVEDDLGTPEGARAAEEKLLAARVAAVIGHYTSRQTLAGYRVTEAAGMVLISATASTSELSGKKDAFFRTVVSTDRLGEQFAGYIYAQRGVERLALILDEDNQAYAGPLAEAFSATYSRLGGEIPVTLRFSEAANQDLGALVAGLAAQQAQGVLIIASPASTALIAQMIRLEGLDYPLFSSSWGQGESLIHNGGKAVEGMEFILGLDMDDPDPRLDNFKQRYQELHSAPPSFTAVEGYETMLMLAAALQRTGGKAEGLPAALSALQDFQGLSGPIRMDEYGDAVRPVFIQRVEAGSFHTVEKLEGLE